MGPKKIYCSYTQTQDTTHNFRTELVVALALALRYLRFLRFAVRIGLIDYPPDSGGRAVCGGAQSAAA